MEKKKRTLDQLSDAGQDVIALLQSPEAGAKIEADTEELTHRWDGLVQKLEDYSFQVCVVVFFAQPLCTALREGVLSFCCDCT